MIRRKILNVVIGIVLIPFGNLFAQSVYSDTHYHTGQQIQQALNETQQKHQATTRLHTIAESPGGEPVSVIEIGSNQKNVPAVFVGANFEGNVPVATEGALRLIEMLIDSSQYTSGVKWYIMPQPNPDAAKNFFSNVKYGRTVNDLDVNNDVDEAVNEDGYEDLNGDGYITQMRVKNLNGTHVVSQSDARIMEEADAAGGERGEYKIYSEGIDNDTDGAYNEDGVGGINVGISFPHLFPEKNKSAGLWPGQAPEVYGILKFIYEHPEIAMVHTLGTSDFCLSPPKGGRKGDPDLNRIKLPGRYARMLNADENQTYTLDQVVELVKEYLPEGEEVTPQRVAGMLNLGEAVNPLEEDLKFYSEFSDEYKAYLKSRSFSLDKLDPHPAKDGSFELWAYYHLGVPSFSMNLFSVPLAEEDKPEDENIPSADEVGKMNAEKFSALGEERVEALLKAYKAPDDFTAVKVLGMMKAGKLTPEQLMAQLKETSQPEQEKGSNQKGKALLAWSDKELEGKGFVEWEVYEHPQLGEVEIGGFIPGLETTPKGEDLDSLLSVQLPWLLQLTKKLPVISMVKEELVEKGTGVYNLNVYIQNKGQLPYPIAMGQRNNQPAPVVIVLEGDFELLEGLKRTPLRHIGANQVKKISWLIKAGKKTEITARLESVVFPEEVKQINTGDSL